MKRLFLFAVCIILLTGFLPADGGADSLDAFLARLRQEGTLPDDDEWIGQLRMALEEQIRRGTIHASAYGLVAEMFPARTEDDDPAAAGAFACRLLESADESLRRGEAPAMIRGRMRREVTAFLKGPSEQAGGRNNSSAAKAVQNRLENRGRDNRPGFAPPGLEKNPGGPGEITPGPPHGPGTDNSNPGVPAR